MMITKIECLGSKHLTQTKNTESTKRQKTSFQTEIVENAELHKPVLNKIMTTQE